MVLIFLRFGDIHCFTAKHFSASAICIHMAHQHTKRKQISNAFEWKSIVLRTRWSMENWQMRLLTAWLGFHSILCSCSRFPPGNSFNNRKIHCLTELLFRTKRMYSTMKCENAGMCQRQRQNSIRFKLKMEIVRMSNVFIQQSKV